MALKDTSALYTQARLGGLAIAFFRLPGGQKIDHISGHTVKSIAKGEKAFVFGPFASTFKPYFIVPDGKASVVNNAEEIITKSTSKEAFTEYVKNIVVAIDSGAYKKIVAARVFAADRSAAFEPVAFFEKLCDTYPEAFVSLTYIPNVGLWIGASPEVLASQNASSITTYALAGTKTIEDDTDWGEKEKEEQRIVSYLIGQKLTRISRHVKMKGPVIHPAGKLKHLLTVFTLQSKEEGLWYKVVESLHPTPAVGGTPQRKATVFIREHESFDRKFYAGYLGPVNWNGKTDIFVNLRCMEVTETQLIFYAGCGITTDSDPEKEWIESERKIDVLRGLL